jgi:hypothetical protein
VQTGRSPIRIEGKWHMGHQGQTVLRDAQNTKADLARES